MPATCSLIGSRFASPPAQMPTRREFVAYSFAIAAGLRPSRVLPPVRMLRVGLAFDANDRALRAGAEFGCAEANRSGSLFGWEVSPVFIGSKSSSSTDAVHALLVGDGIVTRDDIPVLCCAGDGNRSGHCLSLVPSAAVIAAAIRETPRTVSENAQYAVVLWHASLEKFGAQQLNDRYRAATGSPMTSAAWAGWFGVKALFESAMRTKSVDAATVTAYLRAPTTQFDGHKGAPLSFDAAGILRQPLYVLREGAGGGVLVREVTPEQASP